MPSKVYVIQEVPGKNILSAGNYGEIVILLPEDKQIIFSPGPTLYELKQKLFKFCDNDYLLLIGDPVAIALACMVAADNNRGSLKLLKWDKQERVYYPIKIDLYPERKRPE